jgi:hypothetical protein
MEENYLRYNARTVSRRQNKLVGKFKMVAGDLVSIRGQVMEYTCIPTGIKGEMVRSGVDWCFPFHVVCILYQMITCIWYLIYNSSCYLTGMLLQPTGCIERKTLISQQTMKQPPKLILFKQNVEMLTT